MKDHSVTEWLQDMRRLRNFFWLQKGRRAGVGARPAVARAGRGCGELIVISALSVIAVVKHFLLTSVDFLTFSLCGDSLCITHS